MPRSEPQTDKQMESLVKDLSTKGWGFLEMDQDLVDLIPPMTKAITSFFNKDAEEKKAHQGPYGFGYSQVDHKEGLRILTGWRFSGTFSKSYKERLNPSQDSSNPI